MWRLTHRGALGSLGGEPIAARYGRSVHGAPDKPLPVNVFSIIWRRRNFAGSLIGGLRETQEMLDVCATHGITTVTETFGMDEIEGAYRCLLKRDVMYAMAENGSKPAA